MQPSRITRPSVAPVPNQQAQAHPSTKPRLNNEGYMELFKVQHELTKTRWTVTTFFMSVSFAILGFSFQHELVAPNNTILRIIGVSIYWFAFVLFLHTHNYNMWIRTYLEEMERRNQTTMKMMAWFKQQYGHKHRSVLTKLLLGGFGVLYTVAVYGLWNMGV